MASYNSWPAQRHIAGTLRASEAACIAAARRLAVTNKYDNPGRFRFKAVYFNVAGTLDVVDCDGHKERITGGISSMYPCQNFGAVTGGSLADNEFILLYD